MCGVFLLKRLPSYYLSGLGDPLIKGLTEVANLRPNDPITFLAHYLLNFAKENKPSAALTTSAIVAAEPDVEVENQAPPAPNLVTRAGSAKSTKAKSAKSTKSGKASGKRSLASEMDFDDDGPEALLPTAPSDDRVSA